MYSRDSAEIMGTADSSRILWLATSGPDLVISFLFFSGPFLSCIRCPTAYHKQDRCVPAGTFLLNSSWVVCSEHSDKSAGGRKTKINVNFCFACGLGMCVLFFRLVSFVKCQKFGDFKAVF